MITIRTNVDDWRKSETDLSANKALDRKKRVVAEVAVQRIIFAVMTPRLTRSITSAGSA
jgi:hypothetical protein